MTDLKRLQKAFKRNHWIIRAQSEGLTHKDSLLQLPFRGNCLNWVLGHIAVGREQLLEQLGESSVLTEDEIALYLRGTEAITEESAAVPLEQLLEKIDLAQERIVAALAQLSPERLIEIHNEERKQSFGDWIEFELWHETYHVGQLEYLRQLAGKDDSIID